jgi:hypothetical protein
MSEFHGQTTLHEGPWRWCGHCFFSERKTETMILPPVHIRAFFAGLLLIVLCSCDSRLFVGDSRDIGGGYRLKRSGNPVQFALITPHENGGLIIDEIGWSNPVIIARGSGSEYWDAIDTAHAQHIRISDATRKSHGVYQSIPIQPAGQAWEALNAQKRLW